MKFGQIHDCKELRNLNRNFAIVDKFHHKYLIGTNENEVWVVYDEKFDNTFIIIRCPYCGTLLEDK